MKISQVARRYAKALYETTKAHKTNELVLAELRALKAVFKDEEIIYSFISSPIVSADQKINLVKKTFEGKLTAELYSTLLLLADKNRLNIFSDLVDAYEEISDTDHGVTRGNVRSAMALSPESRKQIEDTVTKVTGKKVILNFNEDPKLLGGMVAQVGGWTFDDSLSSHLRRMHEELNRRAN